MKWIYLAVCIPVIFLVSGSLAQLISTSETPSQGAFGIGLQTSQTTIIPAQVMPPDGYAMSPGGYAMPPGGYATAAPNTAQNQMRYSQDYTMPPELAPMSPSGYAATAPSSAQGPLQFGPNTAPMYSFGGEDVPAQVTPAVTPIAPPINLPIGYPEWAESLYYPSYIGSSEGYPAWALATYGYVPRVFSTDIHKPYVEPVILGRYFWNWI